MWEILLLLGPMPVMLLFLNRWTGLAFSILAFPHAFLAFAICDMASGGPAIHAYHEWVGVPLIYGIARTVQVWFQHDINPVPPPQSEL